MLFMVVSCNNKNSGDGVMPEFTPFVLSVDSEACSVDICYQRIANVDDSPILADIEAHNYAHSFEGYAVEPMDVKASAQLLVDEYTEGGEQNLRHSMSGYYYTMDQSAHLARGESILCYETYIEAYTGGAHSGFSMWYECYDLATGRLYDFEYLFEGEWGMSMRELILSRIREVVAEPFVESADMLPVTKSVLITESGLTLVYQPYAVACFAAGIISIELSDAEIAATGAPLVWVAE